MELTISFDRGSEDHVSHMETWLQNLLWGQGYAMIESRYDASQDKQEMVFVLRSKPNGVIGSRYEGGS